MKLLVVLVAVFPLVAPSCDNGDKVYKNKESFLTPDGCSNCTCDGNVVQCQLLHCKCKYGSPVENNVCGGKAGFQCSKGTTCSFKPEFPDTTGVCCYDEQPCIGQDGTVYLSGATFPADDGCNTCSCSNGRILCTLIACEVHPGQCPVANQFGICVELCSSDAECLPSEKCCSNGCGHQCTQVSGTCKFGSPSSICGGIAGFVCPKGTTCSFMPDYPDAAGTCCYDEPPCVDKDGTVYISGETFSPDEGCNDCTCIRGNIGCTDRACASCKYNGQIYEHGAIFPDVEGCNQCSCDNGVVACTEKLCLDSCLYDGKEYEHGSVFTATDGCNECSCSDGLVACTKKLCEEVHRGQCPVANQIGICVELCSSDAECPESEKCCSNGCGHQCTQVSGNGCYMNGIYHRDGYTMGGRCGGCKCRGGQWTCISYLCALPPCDPTLWQQKKQDCCPSCPDSDKLLIK